MDAGRHPLIDVVTNAEVIGCEGEPGAFHVRVRKNPRYVREDLCVACGLCAEACPWEVKDKDFDSSMKPRKAIYRLFPQSVPATYIIDMDICKKCVLCGKACDVGAIDLEMKAEEFTVDAG